MDFDTTRPTYRTDPNRCHISHVVAETGFGRRDFLEISDPWDAENTIRTFVRGESSPSDETPGSCRCKPDQSG